MEDFQGRFLRTSLGCGIMLAHLHADGNSRENVTDARSEEVIAGKKS